ncbi:MAG: oligosaccharide flippase family protein [Oscillospiraceae bacterium]|nr:oligosaccharide flippase family protein [Oscillospiraceae bacterium]
MKSPFSRLSSKKGVLLKNTLMLYILQFSNFFLALVAVPYETRVLSPVNYGKLGVATAIMVYFQLVIDFGFLLSATEEVSRKRDDKQAVSRILTAVTINKLILAAGSAVVLFVLCHLIPKWGEDMGFYFLFFGATVLTSMMPDYLYRGLEQMTAITVRSVLIKAFFTLMIFIFLRKPTDYYIVPILNMIGNGLALLGVFWHLNKKLGIRFAPVGAKEVWGNFRRSVTFFYSRIAGTAYTAANTIILDLMTAGGASVGFYTSADKLVQTGRNCLSPISDSLYPYMVANRDFKLVKKVLCVLMPIIIAGCTVIFVFAEPLCTMFFGAEYAQTGQVLRAMLPVCVFTLPTYILGFPTLTAMGLSKHANYSVVVSAVVHIVNLIVVYCTGHLNMVTMGLLVSVAEGVTLLYRVVVIVTHRHLLKEPPKHDG